jgi:CYTH domain-containing protein
MFLKRDAATIQNIQRRATSRAYIEQGYLSCDKGTSVRVRYSKKDKPIWTLTIKQDVYNRVVEIEKRLSERDARDLWGCCQSKLTKIRHHVPDKKNRMWEIDIFLKERFDEKSCNIFAENVYCVLAEIELPENAPQPSDLPNFIADHLLFAVPLGDGRFSNKKLWNIEHANELYSQLRT